MRTVSAKDNASLLGGGIHKGVHHEKTANCEFL